MARKNLKSSLVFIALAIFVNKVDSANWLQSFFDGVTGSKTEQGLNQRAAEVTEANCGLHRMNSNTTYKIQSPLSSLGMPFFSIYQCGWKFYGTEGCVPVINCSTFELPESPNCKTAGLEITDGLTVTQTFCGKTGPVNVTSGSSALLVNYKTTIAPPTKGFSCAISCADGSPEQQLNTLQDTIPPPKTANCTCGVPGSSNPSDVVPSNRVVGGRDAKQLYWKSLVSLVPKTRKNPFCGGSLLNDRWVLTAAHCIVTTGLVAFPQAADVLLNEYDLKNQSETIPIRRGIVEAIPHPFYNPATQDYDFALIRFSEPLDLSQNSEPYVTPICLPPLHSKLSYAGETGTVVGFGTLQEGGKAADVLQEADIPIITNAECNEKSKYDGKILSSMLCAGYPEGKIDACQGDSGGPFMVPKKNTEGTVRYEEIGVVSFGEGCARQDKPGVYSRVTEANEWIRQLAFDGKWCNE